jgi:2-methylaconitate cis-trans-isomerase PrpF
LRREVDMHASYAMRAGLAVAAAALVGGTVLVQAAPAIADNGLVVDHPCPPGYRGLYIYTDATGPYYVCENVVP